MTTLIGIAVVLVLVVALLVWTSHHRSYKPGSAGHDVNGEARRTKLQAQEKSTRWGAGG